MSAPIPERRQPTVHEIRPGHRLMGWLPLDRLTCPAGHHIRRDTFVLTDAAIRCKHRPPGQRQECGRLLYVLLGIPTRDPRTPPSHAFCIEVSAPEIMAIQHAQLAPYEILELLGATFLPPPPTKTTGLGGRILGP